MLAWSLLTLLACAGGRAGAPDAGERESVGQDGAPPGTVLFELERTNLGEASRRALERGLAYLARRQAETVDGSLPRGKSGEAQKWAPVGVGALGAIAYMSAGNSPGRGPHGREVDRLIQWLVGLTELAPDSPVRGYISKASDRFSRTHGHGFATLALAQAYGMSPQNERLKLALTAAVERIEKSQGSEGGWHYSAQVTSDHEGSVTIAYVQALRSARNSGIQVDARIIHRAEDYVLRLQDDAGRFRYQLDRDDTSVALTAAGVATLNMAGRYDNVAIRDGIDAITKELDPGDRRAPQFPYYERLYVSQAFWHLDDLSMFERWFTREVERLVHSQHSDGSWRDEVYGDCYATAVNCIVLALPQGMLPIFQR